VQKKLWNLVPDERYVADPMKGSRHSRGAAVDVSLVDVSGRELPMPPDYDGFTERAHRDYMRLPVASIKNRALLDRTRVTTTIETDVAIVGGGPVGLTLALDLGLERHGYSFVVRAQPGAQPTVLPPLRSGKARRRARR
jgi:hypothetical protein